MKRTLRFIYLTLISLFSPKLENNEQKSLYKETKPKKMEWNMNKSALIIIFIIITVFVLMSILIYSTGALESTQYYYRIEWLV